MLTPDQARQDYQTAITALRKIAVDPQSTGDARSTARAAAKDLMLNYLGTVEMEIHALTAQYQSFITAMTDLTAQIGGAVTPGSALDELTKLVTKGGEIAGLVTAAVTRDLTAPAATIAKAGVRILCIHGVGHGEADPALQPSWRQAITQGLQRWNQTDAVEFQFLAYDELFAKAPLSAVEMAAALAKLTASGIFYGIGDFLGLTRDFGGIEATLRWTAGMVVQWAEDDALRKATRERVLDAVKSFDPHVICAHSLGTLISYDALARPENKKLVDGRTYVTFGSQVGNPFIRSSFGGRIVDVPARKWFHLFNTNDRVFTAQIRLNDSNFEQVSATFDAPGILNHDADRYLGHPNAVNTVWREIAGGNRSRTLERTSQAFEKALERPKKRALLIGINDYPDPANRLEGCVNDVFLMSSVLQECGFDPEDIRIVLNERATAAGILERLHWLLDGSEDGQERVLFYSGHGAQIPAYGSKDEVDHQDECLVPYDFNWSLETAITDDQLHELYSQLPYDARFLAIFDCCHSGGLTREGGMRARGLTPPDDIRHRAMRWNAKEQMWEQRDLEEVNPNADKWAQKNFFGKDGSTHRLGRSAALRTQTNKRYDELRKELGHYGPYLPVLLEACGEEQLSYEYRHGVTSYGAFTYSLAQVFRSVRKKGLTWSELVDATAQKLKRLRYDQTPQLVCPKDTASKPIPWKAAASGKAKK